MFDIGIIFNVHISLTSKIPHVIPKTIQCHNTHMSMTHKLLYIIFVLFLPPFVFVKNKLQNSDCFSLMTNNGRNCKIDSSFVFISLPATKSSAKGTWGHLLLQKQTLWGGTNSIVLSYYLCINQPQTKC